MTVIRVLAVYLHQGHVLHPKLCYGVAAEVAAGLSGLGLADIVNEPADLSLEALTWPADMATAGEISPDPMEHPHDDAR